MKILVQILRFIIGGLFIFSGLVKANDPLGLAYKMEEYFELWRLFWLTPYTETLSVSMNALEIISGAALCLGWFKKWNLRLLLALILFFTALTGYTFYTGNPKTCGCFGDCLPITSQISFLKDIALLMGIGLLYFQQRHIKPLAPPRVIQISMAFVAISSIGLEFYVLHHLPIVDCLPYRVGVNISEARKRPPSPRGSTVILVYEKKGSEISFPADRFPADFSPETYRYLRRIDTGDVPQAPIQGFVLNDSSGADVTDEILNMDVAILLFTQQAASVEQWDADLEKVYNLTSKNHFPILLISNVTTGWQRKLAAKYPTLRLLSSDRTPIRTAARVDPTMYFLKKGTIIGKWALADWGTAMTQLK